jgi:hypothetical protein
MAHRTTTNVTDCHYCLGELEHCHGAAIMIEESVYVCSDDPDCLLAAGLHAHIVIDDEPARPAEFSIAN